MTSSTVTLGRWTRRATWYAGLTLIATLIVGFPFWVIVVNSLKPFEETVPANVLLPEAWQAADNYRTVIEEGNLLRGFRNNAILLLIAIPAVLLLSAGAAWVLARSESRWLRPLRVATLIGIVVPPAIVATIFTLKALGIYGGLIGTALFYAALYVPLGIFLLTGFMKTIPMELEEAARIDGASNPVIFLRVIVPLARPALVTIAVLVAVAIWNDFLNPFMLLTDPDRNTLILTLFEFATASTAATTFQWNVVFADVLITTVPMIAAFLVLQRYFTYGLGGIGK